MYCVELQKQGKDEEVPIKEIGMAVAEKNGKKTMFPLKSAHGNKLPCLKVKLSNGSPDHYFAVMWSNYYELAGFDGAGKFKLVRIDIGTPLYLYQTDHNSGRKINNPRTGKPMIDYVAMAMQYGSEYDEKTGWTYGPNQPFAETRDECWDTEDIDSALAQLADRFGDDLANEVMALFVDHPLYREFVVSPVAVAA